MKRRQGGSKTGAKKETSTYQKSPGWQPEEGAASKEVEWEAPRVQLEFKVDHYPLGYAALFQESL